MKCLPWELSGYAGWKGAQMNKKIFLFLILIIIVFIPEYKADASVYNNAYTYYEKYGAENNTPARLNDNDGYIYFCSMGLTSSTSTQYRTVGYTITLTAGGRTDSVEVKLGGTYVKEVSQVKKNGYTYVLRRAKLNLLQSLFNGNSAITWNQIYCNKNTYRFDAIMTVVENNKQLCGIVRESGNYRTISADNNGYLFRTAAGIKNVRKWAKPSDLDSFFNKSVVFSPVNYTNTRDAYAEGEAGNVFYDNGTYYVRKNSVVRLAFESYFADAEAASPVFHPNYNIYSITGWGDNQKYYTMQKKNSKTGEYSGIVKDGTGTEKPLGIIGTVTGVTTGYNDCRHAFSSMARFNFNTPDKEVTYVNTEGRVYYDYSYPDNLNDISNMCDKSRNQDNTLILVSDASAPEVYVPPYISLMENAYIPVSAIDNGSGIRSIALVREDGLIIDQVNYAGRNTVILSENDIKVVADNYKYFIRVFDNVGNVSDTEYIVFSKPRAHTVNASIAGGINGYNSSIINTYVYGGNFQVAALTILSEEDMNPSGERVVFANQSVMAHTIPSGLYTYRYSFNPMYYLNGKPDGVYNIDVISGGTYVSANPVSLVLKKDKTAPEIYIDNEVSDKKWYRGNIILFVKAEDNYSGVDNVEIMVNNELMQSSAKNKNGEKTLHYLIDSPGKNIIRISASDVAGNVNTKSLTYMLDKTPPSILLTKTFTGLERKNNIWLNREGLRGKIYVSDELSGLNNKNSNYTLIKREPDRVAEVNIKNPVNIQVQDINNVVLSFSDELIDSMVSGKYDYMIEARDIAGNSSIVEFYINVDFDAPEADYRCDNPWNENTLKGNIHVTDKHSGISSIEVYCDEICERSIYNINKNEYVINLDMSEYLRSMPSQMYMRITDVAGNISDIPLAKCDGIQIKAFVQRNDSNGKPLFMAGENAVLKIEYKGDADIIKVFFPDKLLKHNPSLGMQYDVSDRNSLNMMQGFNIPMKTESGPYHLTVTAYKGDKEYTVYPTFEVYGCITQQFRTRIR